MGRRGCSRLEAPFAGGAVPGERLQLRRDMRRRKQGRKGRGVVTVGSLGKWGGDGARRRARGLPGLTGGVEAAGGPCGGVAGVAPPAAPAAGEVACRDAAAFQNFGAREAGRKTGHVYSIRRAYFAMKSAQILPREPWTSFVLFRLCRGQEVRAGQSNGTGFRPGLRIRSGIVDRTTVCHRRESTLRPAKSFATLINAGRLMPE